jgi:hypothetical protein
VRFLSICGSVPEGNAVNLSPQRKWPGVNAFSVSWVMGLEFRAASMLTRVVADSSSVACDRPNTFRRHLFVMRRGVRVQNKTTHIALRHYTLLPTDTEASLPEIYSVPVILHKRGHFTLP